MEDKKSLSTLRDLLTEVLKEGETGIYIGKNQPPSRDFKIKCSSCQGLSNPSTVFFNDKEYEKALSVWDGEAQRVMENFLHRSNGLDDEIELVGGCMECGRTLRAKVHFV